MSARLELPERPVATPSLRPISTAPRLARQARLAMPVAAAVAVAVASPPAPPVVVAVAAAPVATAVMVEILQVVQTLEVPVVRR